MTVASTGFAIGTKILVMSCHKFTPSISAASSSSLGTVRRYAVNSSVLKEMDVAIYGKISESC